MIISLYIFINLSITSIYIYLLYVKVTQTIEVQWSPWFCDLLGIDQENKVLINDIIRDQNIYTLSIFIYLFHFCSITSFINTYLKPIHTQNIRIGNNRIITHLTEVI